MTCHYCPWKGTNHTELIRHMNHHFLIRPFKCSFCDGSFYSAANRNQHETEVHDKKLDRYQCEKCSFISHSVTLWNKHKKEHH